MDVAQSAYLEVSRMKRGGSHIRLTLTITEEEGGYSALCVETGTASCGDTIDEAFRNIKDAVITELRTMHQLGELERYFSEKGIRPNHDKMPDEPIYPKPNQYVTRQNFDAYACS